MIHHRTCWSCEPHGWGHDRPGTRPSVAREHAFVNHDQLAPMTLVDEISANAPVDGIPVEVAPACHAAPVPDQTQADLTHVDLSAIDLTAVEMECMRCRRRASMRFAGMCPTCRDELYAKYDGVGRDVAVEDYEPKMNVTPNAVALKDD